MRMQCGPWLLPSRLWLSSGRVPCFRFIWGGQGSPFHSGISDRSTPSTRKENCREGKGSFLVQGADAEPEDRHLSWGWPRPLGLTPFEPLRQPPDGVAAGGNEQEGKEP